MSKVTFKESLLVPRCVFKKECKDQSKKKKGLSSQASNPATILSNETIPADLRLKLFDNHVRFNKEKPAVPLNVITKSERNEEVTSAFEKIKEDESRVLLNDVPSSKKPLANAILKFIKDTGDVVWNSKFEVSVDGEIVPNSDFRKILHFLIGEVIYTHGQLDIPPGALKVKNKLEILEMPSSWLKYSPRFSSRKQKGDGLPHLWFVY